jgi:FSR family fosmidomycin resistance protein-like MFS transporter
MAQAVEVHGDHVHVVQTLPPSEGRGRFATTIVLGHAVKHALTSGLASVIIPEINLSMGLSGTQVGTLGSVQQFTGWFATIGSRYLGDRFTKMTGAMLGVSLFFTASALFVLGLAPSYPILVLGMLFMGLGPSMFHPPAIGALSRRFPDRRSFAISLHGTGGSLGEVTGPLFAAGMIAVLFYKDALFVSCGIGLVTAFTMWRLLRNNDALVANTAEPIPLRTYLGSFFKFLQNPPLRMIFLVTAFRAVGQASTSIFLPIYLREDLGYSSALVGLYIALGQLAGIGSQPVMGFLSDRIGHKSVILPAMLMYTLILATIPFADGKVQVAIVILALGIFVFSMQSILTSAAIELTGESVSSSATSLIYAASFLGSLAPTIAGIITDAYGLKYAFYFGATFAALGTLTIAMTKMPAKSHSTRVT